MEEQKTSQKSGQVITCESEERIKPQTIENQNNQPLKSTIKTENDGYKEEHVNNINTEEEEAEAFVTKREIEVSSVKVSKVLKLDENELDQNLDLIEFKLFFIANDEYKWIIYKTPEEIKSFFKDFQSEIKNKENKTKYYYTKLINLFEKILDCDTEKIIEEKNALKEIFTDLFNENDFNDNLTLKEFFGISKNSFNAINNGCKPFELYAYKKADPKCLRRVFAFTCKCLECCIFKQQNRRWIILKDDSISYSNNSNDSGGKTIYFFDAETKISRIGKNEIKIHFLSRNLQLKFDTFFQRELFIKEFEKRIETFIKLVANNKYKAYTNEKSNNIAKYFIDGEDYFKDLYEKLNDAKESIFITDWWLSPEVFLRRPVLEKDYINLKKPIDKTQKISRLMDILHKKATEDVKIYVLIYYECSLALTLNSKHTADTLEKLHSNIMVARHPTDALDLLWSHHEKLVIIDQMIGYVGGLDLCWGRYDNNFHPITEPKNTFYYFPFIDYSNARIRDFTNVQNYLIESANRDTETRMPWHDVHTRVIGPVVADIARHFVERWNHAKFEDRGDKNVRLTEVKQNTATKKKNSSGFMMGIIEQVNKMSKKENVNKNNDSITEENSESSSKKSRNKEVKNNNSSLHNILKNAFKKKSNNNIKLNDGSDSDILKKDLEENFIIPKVMIFNNRINDLKNLNEAENYNNISETENEANGNIEESEINIIKKKFILKKGQQEEELRLQQFMEGKEEVDEDHLMQKKTLRSKLVPKNAPIEEPRINSTGSNNFYSNFINQIGIYHNMTNQWFKDLFKGGKNKLETIIRDKYFSKGNVTSTIQVLRSLSKWSGGISKVEHSILNAYLNLIENAENYIYIENQFFVSKSYTDIERENSDFAINKVVENEIALKIRERIERAYRNHQNFKVFIFIPLLPGFAGEPEKSPTLQIILKHTYAGICRNHGLSIIEKLEEIMGDEWKKYIGFYSLRNHGLLNGFPKTEIVYIHSKLMIIDDKYVLCGSANINDRSMKGSRDSEFAILISEKLKSKNIIDGKETLVANFAMNFRKGLMAEHLGLKETDEILNDPLNEELSYLIIETARKNTLNYRQIFKCYPDDTYKNFKSLRSKVNYPENDQERQELLNNYYNLKNNFKGHIVEFPLHFLEEEDLGIPFFAAENLVPERNFT